MRPIDADALKDKLQQHHDFYVMAWGGFGKMPIGEKKRVDEITNCIAEVVNAPTIELKQGEWIPCSERLPEKAGHYLCSFKKANRIDSIYIDLAYWTGGRWYGYLANEINAWMPLPKPWKGADDEVR